MSRVAWLLMAALLLMIGSFVVLAQWGGAPPGSTYVPAHFEEGKFVPGDEVSPPVRSPRRGDGASMTAAPPVWRQRAARGSAA